MQTSLFDISSIKLPEKKIVKEKTKSVSIKSSSHNKVIIGKASEKLSTVIGQIAMGETTHCVSMGEWSAHNLLFYVLKQTGAAKVYFSTWSISETAIREIIASMDNGAIEKLYGVFDWRVKVRRPAAFEMANYNIANVRLTTCHAKVTVVQNDKWSVSIVSSANYTNNPRIEAMVITCDHNVANFHKGWILDEINKADPFGTKKRKRKL